MKFLNDDQELLKYAVERATRPKRILFVEDEPMVRDIFSSYASRFHCVFETCDTAAEAIERVKNQQYDTILLDMRLPDMKGVELFSRLLSIAPRMNFVIVSGYLTDDMIDDVTRIGFALFVKKPTGFRPAVMDRMFRTLGIEAKEENSLVPNDEEE